MKYTLKKYLAGMAAAVLLITGVGGQSFAYDEEGADIASDPEAAMMEGTGLWEAEAETVPQDPDEIWIDEQIALIEKDLDALGCVDEVETFATTDRCEKRVNYNALQLKNYIDQYGISVGGDAPYIIYTNPNNTSEYKGTVRIIHSSADVLTFKFLGYNENDTDKVQEEVIFEYYLPSNMISQITATYVREKEKATASALTDVSMGTITQDMNYTFSNFTTNNESITKISDKVIELFNTCVKYQMKLTQSLLDTKVGFSMADIGFKSYDTMKNFNHIMDGKMCILCNMVILPFTDVAESDWYFSQVQTIYQRGMMKGTTDKTFAPLLELTRAQFAVVLYRIEGSPKTSFAQKFPDVADGLWYSTEITWANNAGVVGGYGNGNFGPDDSITREQICVMMYRYADYKRYDTKARASLVMFQDSGRVSDYAKEAVQWCVAHGIVSGKNNGTLIDPQGTATRAETATIINRFYDSFMKPQ